MAEQLVILQPTGKAETPCLADASPKHRRRYTNFSELLDCLASNWPSCISSLTSHNLKDRLCSQSASQPLRIWQLPIFKLSLVDFGVSLRRRIRHNVHLSVVYRDHLTKLDGLSMLSPIRCSQLLGLRRLSAEGLSHSPSTRQFASMS